MANPGAPMGMPSGGMMPLAGQNVPSPGGNMMGGPPTGAGLMPPGANQMANSPHAPVPAVPPSQPPHPNASLSQHNPYDLTRLKSLVHALRESLSGLNRIMSMNLNHHSSQLDNSSANKHIEKPPKVDKQYEDFIAICNQVELCLRTILECTIQIRDSQNYLPFQVTREVHIESQPNVFPENNKSYIQYLSVIKKQINFAKSVCEIISDTTKQAKPIDPAMAMQQQQTPQMTMHQPPNQMMPQLPQ